MPDLGKLHNLASQLRERVEKQAVEKSNRWYNIRNSGSSVAELYIYDEIGANGVSAVDMINELKDVKAKQIHLHLSSEGGEVFDGIAIYEALKQHPAKVRTVVDSLAASAASFIAMAADPYDQAKDTGGVFMARNARMMIHDAACAGGVVYGNAADMRRFIDDVTAVADLLDDMSNNIADIYATRTGDTVESWRALMSAETWFSAQQAIDKKLADGIIGEQQKTTSATPAEETTKDELDLDFEALAAALKGAWDGA
jgi:ATP-dependent protease ClpP protease subunit